MLPGLSRAALSPRPRVQMKTMLVMARVQMKTMLAMARVQMKTILAVAAAMAEAPADPNA